MSRRLHFIALTTVLLWPTPLAAQWWDAHMPLRGELQIGLLGQNITVQNRYLPDGTSQVLRDMFVGQLDPRLVPPLEAVDSILAGFFPALGLSEPDISTLGNLHFDALLERTNAPISLNYGATDWLSAFAVIPLVRSQSFVVPQLDSLATNAGLTSTAFGGDSTGLFQELNSGIAQMEAIVQSGTLNPTEQAEAERLLADAQAYEAGLDELARQDYFPTDSGFNGQELTAFYEDLQSGFQTFGVAMPDVPLAGAMSSLEASAAAEWSEAGIEEPYSQDTGIKFGDIALGISVQPLNMFRQRPDRPRPKLAARAKFDALYRLATGSVPAPYQIFDLGTGDGQPDVEFRATLDVAYGRRFWVSLFGGYNIQLEAEVGRLITSPVAPIQAGAYVATVRWNPGDILTVTAAPRFNLTRFITFSGLFMITRHSRDQFEAIDEAPVGSPFVPGDLEEGTEWNARSLGFSARFSTMNWSGDRRSGMPIEVELSYLHTVSGSDGFVPEQNIWQVGLRWFQRIFR
jgi:hypothetical protein